MTRGGSQHTQRYDRIRSTCTDRYGSHQSEPHTTCFRSYLHLDFAKLRQVLMCIVTETRGRICFTAGCDMLSPGDHQTYCHQYRRPLPPILSPVTAQHHHTASTPVRLQNALLPLFDELHELNRGLANWRLFNEQAERLVQEQAQAQLRDDYLMQAMMLEQRAQQRGRNATGPEAQIADPNQEYNHAAFTGTTMVEPPQHLIDGMMQPRRSSYSAP